jgi:probable addiction module antidote protein
VEDQRRVKETGMLSVDSPLIPEPLYKALSGERSPGFDTILKVIHALGLKLHAEANQENY